eukprot:m.93269 g.93269  ORF g.93269 m.93269 type:complete len:1345 (+) comp21771_c0_seq1:150-4184(+)
MMLLRVVGLVCLFFFLCSADIIFESCPVSQHNVPTLPGEAFALVSYTVKATEEGQVKLLKTETDKKFYIGSTPLIFEVEDSSQNPYVCSFSITVVDDENPTLYCPFSVTIASNSDTVNVEQYCSFLSNAAATTAAPPTTAETAAASSTLSTPCVIRATDNDLVVSLTSSVSVLDVDDTTVTAVFTAKDVNGKKSTCSVDITSASIAGAVTSQISSITTSASGEELSTEERSAAASLLSSVATSISANDTAAMDAIASAMTTVAGNGSAALDNSARADLTNTANSLIALRLQQVNSDNSKVEQCGNNVCLPSKEDCVSCPSDCGACTQTQSLTQYSVPSVSVVKRWLAGPTGFGTVRTTISAANYTDDINNVLSITSFNRRQFLSEAGVVFGGVQIMNPLVTAPSGHEFFGNLFAVSSPSNTLEEVSVKLDLAHLGRNLKGQVLAIMSWNSTSASWTASACETNSATLDTATTFVALDCTFSKGVTQTALFLKGTRPPTFEENLVASMGSVMVVDANTTLPTNKTNSSPKSSADATATRAINVAVLEVLDNVATIVSSSLSPEDPPAVIDTPNVVVQAEKVDKSNLGNLTTTIGDSASPAVTLPEGFGSTLSSGGDVALAMTVFKANPFKWSASTKSIKSSIVDFTVKDTSASTNVQVDGLPTYIELRIDTDEAAPDYQKVCRFWDPDLVDPNCPYDSSSSACMGAWSTEGVELSSTATSNGSTTTFCRTKHLSSFGVEIDFTISKPEVSADNFDFSKSTIIYIVFGSFFGFTMLVGFYSWVERKNYDRRELKIARGELVDEIPPPPETDFSGMRRFWIYRTVAHFLVGLKTKHAWISILWPSGRKVYPKRFFKVFALMASTSLAFGLNAIFAYTVTQNQNPDGVRTVNTMLVKTVWGSWRMPMEGIYSFFMSLPLVLLLSYCMGHYSAYIDILRKVAPKRFRALNPLIRQYLKERGLELEILRREEELEASHPKTAIDYLGKLIDAAEEKSMMALQSFIRNPDLDRPSRPSFDEEHTESRNTSETSLSSTLSHSQWGRNRSLSMVEQMPVELEGNPYHQMSKTLPRQASGDTSSVHSMEDMASSMGTISSSTRLCGDSNNSNRTSTGKHNKRFSLWSLFPSKVKPASPSSVEQEEPTGKHVLVKDMDLTEKQRLKISLINEDEYCPEVEELVVTMRRWKVATLVVGSLIMAGGLLLALLFMGSLEQDQQKRWLKTFGEFVMMSAIITAPLFLFISSALVAYEERKKKQAKLLEEREQNPQNTGESSSDPVEKKKQMGGSQQAEYEDEDESEHDDEEDEEGEGKDFKAQRNQKTNEEVRARMKAMIQVELGRNLRAGFASNFAVI